MEKSKGSQYLLIGGTAAGLLALFFVAGKAKADAGGNDGVGPGTALRSKKIDDTTPTPSQFAAKWNGGDSNSWKELKAVNPGLKDTKIPRYETGATVPFGYWDSLAPWVIGQVVFLPVHWKG